MALVDDLNFSGAAIFKGISQDAVEQFRSRGRTVTFETGHTLFERGQKANELMVLQEGIIELLFPVEIMGVTRAVALESKQPGDVVAWSSLVDPYCFTLSARCASACTLNGFSREAVHEFFSSDPATGYLFMRNLAGVIGRRLQAMQMIWMHDLQASAARRLEK